MSRCTEGSTITFDDFPILYCRFVCSCCGAETDIWGMCSPCYDQWQAETVAKAPEGCIQPLVCGLGHRCIAKCSTFENARAMR